MEESAALAKWTATTERTALCEKSAAQTTGGKWRCVWGEIKLGSVPSTAKRLTALTDRVFMLQKKKEKESSMSAWRGQFIATGAAAPRLCNRICALTHTHTRTQDLTAAEAYVTQ